MITEYLGACDASAAEAVGENLFVVANDEENVLRVYRRDEGGPPLATFDLNAYLGIEQDDQHPEADIEGSTTVGGRTYWVTSHGRNKEGKERPNRRRFFALDITPTPGGGVSFAPVGEPYEKLVVDMLAVPALKKHLEAAEKLAPEASGGLNIEGLIALSNGTMLIGFRNPIPDKKALVVPLLNPAELLAHSPAIFGEPIMLDLGNRGVRSIAYLREQKRYVIVAGAPGDEKKFALFGWDGPGSRAPKELTGLDLKGLNPEAAVAYPDLSSQVQLLSDDGQVKIGGTECKALPPEKRKFRSLMISV